jgi:autotransporter translocation and assembly factor TamB
MHRSRPYRFARALGRGLVYTLAGIFVLVGLAIAAVETGWVKNQLRALIVRQANQYLTANLEIDRFEGSIFRGLTLGGVRLSQDGQTLISIAEVSLSYSIRELVEQGTVIRRITLTRPQVVAAKRPDGRWNLAALVRRERRANQQSGPGRPIHILSIGLVDGRVVLEDPLTFGAAQVPSHFEELNAEFSFDYVPVTWTLNFASARWKGIPGELTVSSLRGVIASGGDGWRFDGLQVDTVESAFALDGRVDRRVSPTELDFTVDAKRFAFQEWAGVLPGLRNLAIAGPFTARLKGPQARLATAIDMATNGGAVRGSLVLNTTIPGWHGKGTLNVHRLDLNPWFNRKDRPSDITGRVDFDLDLRLGTWPVGSYAFDGGHTRYLMYEADNLVARGTLTPADVRIASATATAYGANLRLTAGNIGLADPYPFRFVGTANGVDLRDVPKDVPVPHVQSVLTFDYDVTGRFSKPYIAGSARFGDSEFLGAAIGAGAVGAIDTLAQPIHYSGEGALVGVELRRFGAELGIDWLQQPRYRGTTSGRFHVDGHGSDLATMTLEGGGRLNRAELFDGELNSADVSIAIANGSLSGSYSGNLLHVNPAIPMEDVLYDASLTGRATARINVRDLLVRAPTLANYTIDAQLSVRNSVIRKIQVDEGQVSAELKDNGTLAIRQMALNGAAIDGTAAGTIELDGVRGSQLDYEITRGDLAQLTALTGTDAVGTFATSGRMSGPTTELRFAGQASASQLQVAGVKVLTTNAKYEAVVPTDATDRSRVQFDGDASFIEAFGSQIGQASGTVTYDASRVVLDLTVEQSAAITGRLASSFEIDTAGRSIALSALSIAFRRGTWRLTASERPRISWTDDSVTVGALTLAAASGGERLTVDGTWRADGAGPGMKVTARGVFLDTFAPSAQQPVRYGGTLDLDATIGGTREMPVVGGSFAVTNGRLRRLSYERFAGRLDFAHDTLQIDVRLDQAPGIWLTAKGAVPRALVDSRLPEQPIDVAVMSSPISLTLLEGVTDVVRDVSGQIQLDVRAVGTSRDPHFNGGINLTNAAFMVVSSGARYRNGRASVRLAPDRVTVDALHVEDRRGRALDLRGSLGTHELRVGDLEISASAKQFELLRNEFGEIQVDANLTLVGQFEAPRVSGRITITSGTVQVDRILDRTLFQPYSTEATPIPAEVDAIVALNPWERLGLDVELHVPNTLRMAGDNVQVTPGTPLGLGNFNLRVLGDVYLYKDPGQPLYINGSFDQVTGTYTFQGRRFDLDPTSSINFRGDLNPELFVTVTRDISGVETRVTIAGELRQPELRLASTPPLETTDILSLIVFNTSTNQLSALQQQELAVRAGTLAAGFLAAPLLSALERSLGISTLEIEPASSARPGDLASGARVTIGDELAPGLVARFSRQFGPEPYDEATIEYYLSRILRIRATFSDAADLIATSPFRRVERAGIDLIVFFSF